LISDARREALINQARKSCCDVIKQITWRGNNSERGGGEVGGKVVRTNRVGKDGVLSRVAEHRRAIPQRVACRPLMAVISRLSRRLRSESRYRVVFRTSDCETFTIKFNLMQMSFARCQPLRLPLTFMKFDNFPAHSSRNLSWN
jgi:hypothetical protein